MKKKVKKQLKTDEFANFINRALDFVKSYQKEIMIAGGAIVFVALVFLGVKYVQGVNAKKQSALLGQIIALEGELAENPEKLAELEQLCGNGTYGRLACIKVATYAFENGDTNKALNHLDRASAGKKDLIYYQGQDLKAQVLLHQKQYDDAIAIYDQIESENPRSYAMDLVYFNKAKILTEKNEIDQAIELYKKLQEEFPQSYYGYEAARLVLKLEDQK